MQIKCTANISQQEIDFSNLRKHLNKHLHDGIPVKCPAARCGRKMCKVSTLSAHISTKHSQICSLIVNKNLIRSNSNTPMDKDEENVEGIIATDNTKNEEDIDNEPVNTNLFIQNATMFIAEISVSVSYSIKPSSAYSE